jgi:hypothetical protein
LDRPRRGNQIRDPRSIFRAGETHNDVVSKNPPGGIGATGQTCNSLGRGVATCGRGADSLGRGFATRKRLWVSWRRGFATRKCVWVSLGRGFATRKCLWVSWRRGVATRKCLWVSWRRGVAVQLAESVGEVRELRATDVQHAPSHGCFVYNACRMSSGLHRTVYVPPAKGLLDGHFAEVHTRPWSGCPSIT